MKKINGGVTAAKGFTASGIHCGIRKNKNKKDLSLILSEKIAAAACVYTTNIVKGAPIYVTMENTANCKAQAIICNSGNANTCNANGREIAMKMCELTAKHCNINKEDVVVASTGVIGQELSVEPIEKGMEKLVSSLSKDYVSAAEGIMTTDLVMKESSYAFELGGIECKIGGIAKGSGMINPNMATMLVFITTDTAIHPVLLKKALSEVIAETFNTISVDGDTSTNDMVTVLANGMAENPLVKTENGDYTVFKNALYNVCRDLSESVARDGEGATKLLKCKVSSATNTAIALKAAKSVINSSLVKTMIFGSDANFGRVMCAIGYSGVDVEVNKIDIWFVSSAGSIKVCEKGCGIVFDEDIAKKILSQQEVLIEISLNSGEACATAMGCDLSYEYIKINGDYRS